MVAFTHLSEAALMHPALQGPRHVKCKLESHCWDGFASQLKSVWAKGAWSRAAGKGRKVGSVSAALKAFGLWVLMGFGVSSFLFLFLFFFPFLPTSPVPPSGRALSDTHIHFQGQTSPKLAGRDSLKQAPFSLRFLLCL